MRSASENFPGRLKPKHAKIATSQMPMMISAGPRLGGTGQERAHRAAIFHICARNGLAGEEGRFGQPPRQPQRARIEPAGPVAGQVAAGLAAGAHAELCPGRPSSSNSRWSELPVPSSRTQRDGDARAARPPAAGRPPPAAAASRAGERSQKGRSRPTSSSESAKRRRLRPPRARTRRASASAPRWSGDAGVEALLRAGGHEPDVAAGTESPEAARQRGQHAEAGGVVVGAGRARRRVGVRHHDPQAACAGCRARRSRCASARARAPRSAGCPPAARPRGTRAPCTRCARASAALAAGRGPQVGDPRRDRGRIAGRGEGQQRQESSRSSSSGSVTGALQAKCSHT